MSKQTIFLGTVANDSTGTPLRDSFDMVNDNFTELYDFLVGEDTYFNYDATHPSTVGTPAAGYYFFGINSDQLWIKDDAGVIKYFNDATTITAEITAAVDAGLENTAFAQSYMDDYRNRVIADAGTYYINKGASLIGKLNELDLLVDASLIMVPSGVKANSLYSVKNFTNSVFTVVRNDIATGVNVHGDIESEAAHVARIDYSDREAAVLTEPQRENLFLNSDVGVTQPITVVSGQVYSFYFWDGTGTIALTGAHTETVSVSDYSFNNAVTFTAATTTLTCTVSGTANNVQCELGAYPTAWILTAGAGVIRVGDQISGAGGTFNSPEGAMYLDIAALFDDGTNRIISISDGTINNFVIVRYDAISNNIRFAFTVGGVSQATLDYAVTDVTDFHKVVVRWKSADFSLWIDGIKQAEQLSGSTFGAGVLTQVQFSRGDATTFFFYGKSKGLVIFKTYISDANVASLTL